MLQKNIIRIIFLFLLYINKKSWKYIPEKY